MSDEMNQVLETLDRLAVPYEITHHPAVYTIEDMLEQGLPYPECIAKNLFVRDDKKRNYYLFVVREDKHVDMKEMRSRINSRRLSFASDNDLEARLGLKPGAVSPFGVLNDAEHTVQIYIDEDFRKGRIGVHPNDNTATVWIQTEALFAFLQDLGNPVSYLRV